MICWHILGLDEITLTGLNANTREQKIMVVRKASCGKNRTIFATSVIYVLTTSYKEDIYSI